MQVMIFVVLAIGIGSCSFFERSSLPEAVSITQYALAYKADGVEAATFEPSCAPVRRTCVAGCIVTDGSGVKKRFSCSFNFRFKGCAKRKIQKPRRRMLMIFCMVFTCYTYRIT